MRFVIKSENDMTLKLKSSSTQTKLLNIAKNKRKSLISDSIYRDSYETPLGMRSYVEDQLSIAYKNKCAYCERLAKADIEHYRPKKAVTDDSTHEGYYWLCYEWTNLIPSCITCNREGAKHNRFSILGVRVTAPTFLQNGSIDLNANKAQNSPLILEIPELLHPELDKPEIYFEFKIANDGTGIQLVGIDQAGRGKKTIDICKLNRLELTLDRVSQVIDNFKDSIEAAFGLFSIGRYTENQLIESILLQIEILKLQSADVEKTHTFLRKYIVKTKKNFGDLVIPFLATGCQNIVLEAFD